MAVNVCVVGTGYVGLIAAVGLADFGNSVVGVDIDGSKVESLNNGIPPSMNPAARVPEAESRGGTPALLYRYRRLHCGSWGGLHRGGNPSEDRRQRGPLLRGEGGRIGSGKHTGVHGGGHQVHRSGRHNRWIAERISAFNPAVQEGVDFDVVSNPEFLREGKAVQDFFHPTASSSEPGRNGRRRLWRSSTGPST